jgi:hypothetical protein
MGRSRVNRNRTISSGAVPHDVDPSNRVSLRGMRHAIESDQVAAVASLRAAGRRYVKPCCWARSHADPFHRLIGGAVPRSLHARESAAEGSRAAVGVMTIRVGSLLLYHNPAVMRSRRGA